MLQGIKIDKKCKHVSNFPTAILWTLCSSSMLPDTHCVVCCKDCDSAVQGLIFGLTSIRHDAKTRQFLHHSDSIKKESTIRGLYYNTPSLITFLHYKLREGYQCVEMALSSVGGSTLIPLTETVSTSTAPPASKKAIKLIF